MTELDGLLRRITDASACLANFDGWSDHASSSASEEERRAMQAQADAARIDHDAARSELEALVARLRAEQPGAIAAWADAHDARLAAYLASDDAKREYAETAAASAQQARAEWAEVKAGARAYSTEGLYADSIGASQSSA